MEFSVRLCKIANKCSFVFYLVIGFGMAAALLLGIFGVIHMFYSTMLVLALGIMEKLGEFVVAALERPVINTLKSWAIWNAKRILGTDEEINVCIKGREIRFNGPSDEKFVNQFVKRCEEMFDRLGYMLFISYNDQLIVP